ncbi:MAG: DUF411 domain-containing protein [Gemmatimonadetes bacterium]|nr:DUF411 domain-containing protein [Gemmatimonadota bacterium]
MSPHAGRDPNGKPPRRRPSILDDPEKGLTRGQWLSLVGGGIVLVASVMLLGRVGRGWRPGVTPMVMYASENCECCRLWVAHLEANGYRVRIKYTSNLARRKDALGVPPTLRACHTAEVQGVVVEGHVPADVLTRFLSQRSGERGLAVPDMPGGSPGMEVIRKEPYDVFAFQRDGTSRVYAHI